MIFVLLGWCFSLTLQAQDAAFENDPRAATYLEAVSEKYQGAKGVEARLIMTVEMPESDQKVEQEVEAMVKGDKFRIVLESDVMISDGATLWTYLEEVNEVSIYTYDKNTQVISPSRLFALYDEDYNYRVREETATEITIEMAPNDKTLDFFKLDVVIHKASKRIIRSKVYDRSGTRYYFSFESIEFNDSLNDALFTFDPEDYEGIYVVDTRQ